MRQFRSEAGKWIADNNLSWGKKKQQEGGGRAKLSGTKSVRNRRAKANGEKLGKFETIKDFVEAHRGYEGESCLLVPSALPNAPARVPHCGRNITAARYMLLLTVGVPMSDGMVCRHTCGNGHLSCVNPKHLIWGTQGDNIGDMTKHRHAGDDVQDKIAAIVDHGPVVDVK